MIQFDLPKEMSSIIKVIGVGGGGSNAVNHMYNQQIEGVSFVICNTDAQSIAHSKVPNKVQLGPLLTQGLGAGANPEIGRQATEESLEELKRILEVNTKMAFITAGMGGGTGTGGAPTIARICREMGILTVGIVTTPFSYEGKKRLQQAEEGIKNLREYVDTLIIINNDKLRYQFGNLKWKEAFAKADNVLATAAKCITDVINSTGQINVDFADVCTVMRNGGSAILGNAAAKGENRALQAIEEALNSPLLDDSDITGAKFILININSAEGEHEFTMDEVEVIQQYLRSRAGDNADVHLGMGYNNELGENIGITLIATGFERDGKKVVKIPVNAIAQPEEEKIVMVLDMEKDPANEIQTSFPKAAEEDGEALEPFQQTEINFEFYDNNADRLTPTMVEVPETDDDPMEVNFQETGTERIEWLLSDNEPSKENPQVTKHTNQEPNTPQNNSSASAASGGFLAKPTNIYAEPHQNIKSQISEEASSDSDLTMIFKDDLSTADYEPRAHQIQQPVMVIASTEEPALQDEVEEQKRRAAERIQKLRNLSFNVNAADPNNEFETVPAYVRRNLGLRETGSTVENFYSNYEVRKDDKDNVRISEMNKFLQGNKPD